MLRDSTPPNKPLHGSIPVSEKHLLTGKLQYEHTWSFDSCSPNVRMEVYTKPCATTNDGQHWVNHHAKCTVTWDRSLIDCVQSGSDPLYILSSDSRHFASSIFAIA